MAEQLHLRAIRNPNRLSQLSARHHDNAATFEPRLLKRRLNRLSLRGGTIGGLRIQDACHTLAGRETDMIGWIRSGECAEQKADGWHVSKMRCVTKCPVH